MAFSTATAGDPKFWPSWLRYVILSQLCVYVWLGNASAAGIATGFQVLAEEFRTDFSSLSNLISYPVLALGLCNLIWMPLALCIGKRPVMLMSMTIFIAGQIWTIKATTLNSLVGARILASVGAGSVESLGPSIIADLFLEKYFASSMAIFALSLSCGSQVGPLMAGYIIADRNWRWFFIALLIITAVNLAGFLIFVPETTYHRILLFDGETAAAQDKYTMNMVEQVETALPEVTTSPRSDSIERPSYAGNYWADLVNFKLRSMEREGLSALPRQLSLPFRFLLIPAAVFATCAYGIVLGGIVIITTLSPALLSPPPYLFTSEALGLSSLASFTGIIIAYPLAGPCTDIMSQLMKRRNGGIHKPEHRMPTLILAFLIVPSGLILFAYMIAQGRSFYIAAVGYAMQSAGLVLVPSVVISYVMDAYPDSGSEALVLINAGKNAVAFGMTLAANEWFEKAGLTRMFLELAGIQWGVFLFGVPLYFAGPYLGRTTASFVQRGKL